MVIQSMILDARKLKVLYILSISAIGKLQLTWTVGNENLQAVQWHKMKKTMYIN